MKKIISVLSLVCLILFASCSPESIQVPDISDNREEVMVRFMASIPDFKTVQTRAQGGVEDMYLLVFDENGNFIVRSKAVLVKQTNTGGTFTAMLPSSNRSRTIHFISNFPVDDFLDLPGMNEAAVVAQLNTTNYTYWSRIVFTEGISANSFANTTVKMLRNRAKISVTTEAADFTVEGFTIHNAPGKGTVAPYSLTNGFTIGTISEPSGVELLPALIGDMSLVEKYLFERKNASAANITTVIVRGNYKGSVSYYKIDLIDEHKNRYNIERNWHYMVNIKSVTRDGYTNFNDALAGASHNNTALDPVIERFPIISDGKKKLEVEKTLIILTQPNQPFQLWAKYYPDINSELFNNTGVSVALQSGNEAINSSIQFQPSTGIISGTALGSLPGEPGTGLIRVSHGELARTIRVILRTPFSFNPVTINNSNPSTLNGPQNQDAYVRFSLPSDFPSELFPLPVKIITQGLYPAEAGLQMEVENGFIYYTYMATSSGEQNIHFKTNKAGNFETVRINANYFKEGSVHYSPSILEITGTIQYRGFLSWNNVPENATVTVTGVSGATMQVTSSGNYRLTVPFTTSNPSLSFSYTTSGLFGSTYRQTISLSDLITNPSLRLN